MVGGPWGPSQGSRELGWWKGWGAARPPYTLAHEHTVPSQRGMESRVRLVPGQEGHEALASGHQNLGRWHLRDGQQMPPLAWRTAPGCQAKVVLTPKAHAVSSILWSGGSFFLEGQGLPSSRFLISVGWRALPIHTPGPPPCTAAGLPAQPLPMAQNQL